MTIIKLKNAQIPKFLNFSNKLQKICYLEFGVLEILDQENIQQTQSQIESDKPDMDNGNRNRVQARNGKHVNQHQDVHDVQQEVENLESYALLDLLKRLFFAQLGCWAQVRVYRFCQILNLSFLKHLDKFIFFI
jgi:hypothetical protein